MEDWDEFIASCTDREYAACSVIIDNEEYKNAAIRAKGNTSLSGVEDYGNDRYSFKIEFDHYDGANTYYGLDKLSLNNIIRDNTYMKDYLSYQMMRYFGVSTSLCSYAQILVNGEEWGLYLAVEDVEEAFLSRNYGNDCGEIYKPDSMRVDGGRGSGRFSGGGMQMPGMKGGEMGGSDVSLIYSDDEYSSYSNIFDNARTDITAADKDRLIASLKQLNENSSIEEAVNVDAVIRYFVVHNFVCNFDSYTGSIVHNYYLYEKDGQLSLIPWDYNLAFGGFVGGADATSLVNYPIDTPVSGGTVESRPMLSWIFENEEYIELYHQYFAEFISRYFDSGYFAEMTEAVKGMISPFVESDPSKFCTCEEFEQGMDTLKEFCLLRAESIKAQLNGTIASTSDKQDKETFIDASGLSVSDMGSMEGKNQKAAQGQFPTGGNKMKPPQMDGEMPEMPQGGDAENFLPAGNGQEMTRPDNKGGQMENQVSPQDRSYCIMLSLCTAVLLTGLLTALLYKKRV